jgi:transcriptional regulator with PAS, ATPase and Fis domain
MKYIFSWIDKNGDFSNFDKGELKPNGVTLSLHKKFWKEGDVHVILNSDKDRSFMPYKKLIERLKKDFDHKIIEEHLHIVDLINVPEILSKVQGLLSKYKDKEIEIFVSPGTPSMQVAWYFAALNLEVKLFQTRIDSKEKEYIDLDKSTVPTNLNLAYSSSSSTSDKIKITESIKPLYDEAKKIAKAAYVHCLILGANGTGKENLAQHIHDNSPSCKDGELVSINCAAYNDELLNSELFGYKKGAFTGADKDKSGLFEKANNGTLFLDEIGDISPKMQASLLRVLQENEFYPLNSTEPVKVKFRIIAATNKPLYEMARKDEFRLDLYYRLAVAELKLPALDARGKKEKEEYIDFMMDKVWKETFANRAKKLKLSKKAKEVLLGYNYPGNLRELENIIKRLYTFCEKHEADIVDLPDIVMKNDEFTSLRLADVEKMHILKVYKQKEKNIIQTANALGITRNTLKTKLEIYESQRNN